jgi:hypothetical protein
MSFDEDEFLAGGLGDVGGLVGSPARRGAEKAARRLRKDVCEIELAVSMPPPAAAERARQVISEQGSVVDPADPGPAPAAQVIGIVSSGVGGLNPAVVTVTIRPAATGSQLLIRGAAKEGLIRQRAGEKAARRIAAAMT